MDIGDFHLIIFSIALLLFAGYHYWKYLKSNKKGYLLASAGSSLIILGAIISQKNEDIGYLILKVAGSIAIIGYFILLFPLEEEFNKNGLEKNKKKGLMYDPFFILIGQIVVGILFIGFGVYEIFHLYTDHFKGILIIFIGIGVVIHSIITFRRKRIGF